MAEALAAVGVVASVAQLADYGFKLSVRLFTFGQTVYYAEKSVKDISTDVSLTSSVLKELGDTLKRDDEAKLISEQAVLAAEQTVKECLRVFIELDEALTTCMSKMGLLGNEGKKKSKGAMTIEKLKWPFMQPKMELLRSNLERLKASLSLMLNVLIYARGLRGKESSQYQKEIIEGLARTERNSKERFEALRKAIEAGNLSHDNDQAIDDSSKVPDFTITAIAPSETAAGEDLIKTADQQEGFTDYCYTIKGILFEIADMKRFLDHECCELLETAIKGADAVVTRRLECRYGTAFKTIYDQINAIRGWNMAKSVSFDDEGDEVVAEAVIEQERRAWTAIDVPDTIDMDNAKTPLRLYVRTDNTVTPSDAVESVVHIPGSCFEDIPYGANTTEVGRTTEGENGIDSGRAGKDKDEENLVATLLSMWTTLPAEEIAKI